jgi:hypothetical protein
MHIIAKRKNTISFIFLLHFLFYAVTPLSYSFNNNTSHDFFMRDSRTDNKNFHLYIFDIIYSNIPNYSAEKDNDYSRQFILLKKKRTILTEEESKNLLKTVYYVVKDNDILFINHPVQLSVAIDKETLPSKSFTSGFSGLSPPIV